MHVQACVFIASGCLSCHANPVFHVMLVMDLSPSACSMSAMLHRSFVCSVNVAVLLVETCI